MSAFFGARAPELVPEHVNDLTIKPAHHHFLRAALKERSTSELNASNNGKPTIRLVGSDQDSSSIYTKSPFPQSSSQILMPADENTPTRRAPSPNPYLDQYKLAARDGPIVLAPKPLQLKRPNRLSNSTTTSNADTLAADSMFSPTSQRMSFDAPFKRAPTPLDPELHLEPLEEHSPERSIPDIESDSEESGQEQGVQRGDEADYSETAASYNDPYRKNELHLPIIPPRSRPVSNSSALGFSIMPEPQVSSGPASKLSKDSMTDSDPFIVPRQRSASTEHNIIRYASSSESIRPQFVSMRPATAASQSASSLWTADSADIVPPLSMAKQRPHMHSQSLGSQPALNRAQVSFLSTIASESEREQHTSSRHSQTSALERYNPPQNVGGTWPRRRLTVSSSNYSMPQESSHYTLPEDSTQSLGTDSEGSSYNMSRPEVMRNESAIPPPLFSSSQPIPQRPFGRESSELEDTIAELQIPQLRPQRSGYNLRRQRSASDLRAQAADRPTSKRSNHSFADSDRWSQGSTIFPLWARAFYRGRLGLASANHSRVTLAGPQNFSPNASHVTLAGPPYEPSQMSLVRPHARNKHRRADTDTTMTLNTFLARAESTNSNWETIATESPVSRYVPSVFRPRTRARAQTDATVTSRGSMSIYEMPTEEPTARPKGKQPFLRHGSQRNAQSRMVNRNTTAQTQHVPHPLSVEASFISFPRLVPNHRLTHHLNVWRVPSIDEPFPKEIFGRGNRQIVAFCLGFLFPPLWMLAAFLPLPESHVDSINEEVAEMDIDEATKQSVLVGVPQWGWEQERKFLKARWWRTLNRVMSVVGVGILAAIVRSFFSRDSESC